MSAIAIKPSFTARPIHPPRPRHSAKRLFEPTGQTLEDAILGVWEDLVAGGRAGCPVCGGALHAAVGCECCGSELS